MGKEKRRERSGHSRFKYFVKIILNIVFLLIMSQYSDSDYIIY